MSLNIEDAFPEKPEFSLKKTGKTYRLRIPNLADQVYFKQLFTSDSEIAKVFESLEWNKICKIVYRLLEDKSEFLAQEAKIINDEGEATTVRLSGPEVLLASLQGVEEGMAMLGAFNKATMLASPTVDKFIQEEIKKNITNHQDQTGKESLTFYQANTDGQPNTFLNEPQGKLIGGLGQSESESALT